MALLWVNPVPRYQDGRDPRAMSDFGTRDSGYHQGVDMSYLWAPGDPTTFPQAYERPGKNPSAFMPNGTPAFAAGDGVIDAWYKQPNGLAIRIDHGGGVKTLYLHLARRFFQMGVQVKAGTPIGIIGHDPSHSNAFNHLHFEVHRNREPVDPAYYLRRMTILENPYAREKRVAALAMATVSVGVAAVSIAYMLIQVAGSARRG